jgi:hypothetical protein
VEKTDSASGFVGGEGPNKDGDPFDLGEGKAGIMLLPMAEAYGAFTYYVPNH